MHWEYAVPIASIHLLSCLAILPWCFSWFGVIAVALGTIVFGTFGINLGYHRLLSHRSLSVPLWFERLLATLAVCSLEDTPSRWVANHRLHHCHSDDDPDPHSPRDGVAWSHMGWLFRRAPHRRSLEFLGSVWDFWPAGWSLDLRQLGSGRAACREFDCLGCLFTNRSCLAYHVECEFTYTSLWVSHLLDGRR